MKDSHRKSTTKGNKTSHQLTEERVREIVREEMLKDKERKLIDINVLPRQSDNS